MVFVLEPGILARTSSRGGEYINANEDSSTKQQIPNSFRLQPFRNLNSIPHNSSPWLHFISSVFVLPRSRSHALLTWLNQLILFIALGSMTYGYCSSIIATTLGQPSFIGYFDLDTVSNAESLIGAINGLFQAGGLFGALSVLYLPDKLGRLWALFIGSAFCVVGGALQAGSVHIGMFLVARLLTGYGIGKRSNISPTSSY